MASPDKAIARSKKPSLSNLYVSEKGFGIHSPGYRPKTRVFAFMFALAGLLLFARLGSPSIYIVDEARNAQCAREMLQHHTLVVPTFNGKLRTDKPPLHYFFMMAAYKTMGVSSFSARFFSAVMGLLTIAITALFTSHFVSRQAALMTVAVLSCSTHFLFEFRLAVPDPYFIFFVSAGLMSGFTWLKENKPLFLYLTAASLALGVLAKGPVAVALPVLSFLLFTVYKKCWKHLFTWQLVPALLLFLTLTLPWYLLVHTATNGVWTNQFFFEHNVNRFSSAREGHGGFFLLPLLVLLFGLLPFSAFAAEPLKKGKRFFTNDLMVFSLIVFVTIVVFFSLSATQLPNYAMPAYPFAAIIIGYYLGEMLNKEGRLPVYPFYVITAVFWILPFAVYFVLKSEVQTKSVAEIAVVLQIAPLLMTLLLIARKHLNKLLQVYGLMIIFFLFNLLTLLIAYPVVYSNNSVSKTLPVVRSAQHVAAYKRYNAGFNFYLDQSIRQTAQTDSLFIRDPGTVIITRATYLTELDSLHLKIIARQHDIFEGSETVILSK